MDTRGLANATSARGRDYRKRGRRRCRTRSELEQGCRSVSVEGEQASGRDRGRAKARGSSALQGDASPGRRVMESARKSRKDRCSSRLPRLARAEAAERCRLKAVRFRKIQGGGLRSVSGGWGGTTGGAGATDRCSAGGSGWTACCWRHGVAELRHDDDPAALLRLLGSSGCSAPFRRNAKLHSPLLTYD